MKAFEFQIDPPADGSIPLPPEVASQVATASRVKVIVMLADDDDEAWDRLTAEQFFRGYAPSDAIYAND